MLFSDLTYNLSEFLLDKNTQLMLSKATFKETYNCKLIQSQQIRKVLFQNEWSIDHNDYQKYDWKKVFEQMNSCKAQKIWLHSNNQTDIIKQIRNVCFVSLKQLLLAGNNIQNIEALTFINFLCLEQISFTKNQISRIQCVEKLHIATLNSVNFGSNPLNDVQALARSKINADKLKKICLQYDPNINPINNDLSFIVRLNSKIMGRCQIISKKRIMPTRIYQMLNRSSPSISFEGYCFK